MARRKSHFIQDDGDDSDSSSSSGDDATFDPNDLDQAAERELFNNPYRRQQRGVKRTREERKDEATYGVFAPETEEGPSRFNDKDRKGKRASTRAPSFVAAGADTAPSNQPLDNLSDAIPRARLEPAQEDEEDLAMDLGDSDEEDAASEGAVEDDEDQDDDDDQGDDDRLDSELAPVPGLSEPSPDPPPPSAPVVTIKQPTASLAFAPRGLGAARRGIGGGGAIGSGSGGARAGLGASSARSAPAFASATSASSIPLGGSGSNLRVAATQNGADSPMAGASTPKTGLGARPGLGQSGREGSPGGAHGFGARPSSSLVDTLRSELASAAAQSAASSANSSRDSSPGPSSTTTAAASAPPRERRSFLPTASTSSTTTTARAPLKISKKAQHHFAKLASSGSLGMKMLERMGWKAGSGLGVDGQGIVTPIGEGQKVRKDRTGIAQGERSEGAKADERRRKGIASDDEDETERGRKARGKKGKEDKMEKAKEAWTQPQARRREAKVKTEYKTYEQLVAESGAEPEGVGMLVDLSGNALPSQSLSSLPAFGACSADPTRLPELRHNLTLLTSTLSSSLSALAREGKQVEDRRVYLAHEEQRVLGVVERQELAIERVKTILEIVARVKVIESEVSELVKVVLGGAVGGGESVGPKELLDPFVDVFDELFGVFSDEYAELKLDEVVVSAIAPTCRRLFQNWDPLSSSLLAVAELKRWRRHFLIDKRAPAPSRDGLDVDVFGAVGSTRPRNGKSASSDRVMSAYETMMWTIWLPRVRTAINNHWSATDPTPVVALYNAWLPLLPQFLRDNMLDQLVFPKLLKTIQDWSPSAAKRGSLPPLYKIVFPWLEVAGEQRIEFVLDETKRRVRAWLKGWKSSEGVPIGLDVWKDAYTSVDWDGLMLKHVLPQLGATLRETFSINPRAQNLKPLELVLNWSPLLRSSMMSQLLEAEFVPKWLDALYVWLTSAPNLEQVAEWYSWWKSYLPEEIVALSGVSRGLRKGLDLMNQAMALGEDAKYRLKRPDLAPKVSSSTQSKPAKPSRSAVLADEETEISFRSIVEDVAAAHNLVFLSTGKSDEEGRAMFRVSKAIDGKSGVTVYLEEDVVWLLEKDGQWSPVSVEEMCKRALGGS